MKKLHLICLLCFSVTVFAGANIDQDVLNNLRTGKLKSATDSSTLSVLVFLYSNEKKKEFLEDIRHFPNTSFQDLGFMPAVAVTLPANLYDLNRIANHKAVAQISFNNPSTQELDVSVQAIKLAPSSSYLDVNNWWAHGYTGKKGVLGLIDDGVDPTHPDLANKQLIVRTENGSHYEDFINGVRAPHGTGIACIYGSNNEKYKGVAYELPTIITGLSGPENSDAQSIMMTMSTLDWMLERSEIKPTLINYSMGNGSVSCQGCPEWSGLARLIDYVVNEKKILWVKSAGNGGYIEPTKNLHYASTLTVPGDNYNALTVANMSLNVIENNSTMKTADRNQHIIRSTSSRGPTPYGRRKPDLTAPGHDTRTCAPDVQIYRFNYIKDMDYRDGHRLMGGTSSAAPHVGGAALLLQDAGIKNPMAIKALLINSADAWTDSGKSDHEKQAHFSVMGSEWNRTYGWGYINMQAAFEQRNDLIEDELTLKKPVLEYRTDLQVGEKVTLVHERRVGFSADGAAWKLSHLSVEIIDRDTEEVIAKDDSPIDTVHQVANCERLAGERNCSSSTKPIHALVRVKLLSSTIDGSDREPFALVLRTK